jgi:hypothetical protein
LSLSTKGQGIHNRLLHVLLARLLLHVLLLLQVLLDSAASLSARDRRGRAALDYAPAGEAYCGHDTQCEPRSIFVAAELCAGLCADLPLELVLGVSTESAGD